MHAMKEISVTVFGLSTMCRLCLARGVTLLDLFSYSTKFGNLVANAVMKCAPVQIKSGDEMPNFICQKCHTRLEETYQFQMRIMESEKILKRYLAQIHAFDRKPKHKSCIQSPIENSLIENTNADITETCESSEFHDWREKEYENSNSASKISVEMPLKSEIKDEQDKLIISPDCANDTLETFSNDVGESFINMGDSNVMRDMNVNWKVEKPANFTSACESIGKVYLKSEIKDEPMNDGSLILTEFIDDTVNDSSNGVSEMSCEDTKVGFGLISRNSTDHRSSDVEKFEDILKNTSMDGETHKEVSKVKSGQFKIKDTCKKRYIKSRFLETHKSKKSNRCDICNKYFSTKCNLNTHKLLHTVEKPYQCDICKKCFTLPCQLTRHKRIHTGEKPYQCDICKKCFTLSRYLTRHKLIHTGEKPYQCDICKKCFAQSSGLSTHKLIHTGEKPYQCDICKKCFKHSSSLNSHKRIHTGEKPYQCDICKKCFTDSSNLTPHKLIHTGEKSNQCDICKKCFTLPCQLTRHKRIHTGEKPYQCDICKKCFKHSSSLNSHKRIHTGEKPYQCDICKKCFTHLSTLNSHNLIHIGEKPYQCGICKKCFNHPGNLDTHKLIHTGEKPYQCDVCKKCFTQLNSLNTHKLIHITGHKTHEIKMARSQNNV